MSLTFNLARIENSAFYKKRGTDSWTEYVALSISQLFNTGTHTLTKWLTQLRDISQYVLNESNICRAQNWYSSAWAFQRTYYWTPKIKIKIQDGGFPPSWILTPKCKNAISSKTQQFRSSYGVYWRPTGSYVSLSGLFEEPIIGSLQSKITDIRHLENRHYVIFSADCGPIWMKFRILVQNDMSTAVICGNGNQM